MTAGRWIIEQDLALLHQFRRLAARWERRTDIHHGFLDLAAALICWRRLGNRTRSGATAIRYSAQELP